jgi:hypothetical protein
MFFFACNRAGERGRENTILRNFEIFYFEAKREFFFGFHRIFKSAATASQKLKNATLEDGK